MSGGDYDVIVDDLEAAIAEADLRVLLMCLVHLTGETRWLEPPYRPARDVRLIADEHAGLPEAVQQSVRRAAYDVLSGGCVVALPNPDDDLLHRMMNACLGETVAPEYVPMMREDMGFTPRDPCWSDPSALDRSKHKVLIVGAGVSGLCVAVKLDQLGLDFEVIEKNPEVGGTWFENRYPGCGVDTPNHFYSYSFHPNHRWRHYFASRDEVQNYITDFARDTGLRDRVRFSTEVIAARWDDGRSRWSVRVRRPGREEEELSAQFLVSAVGQLNQPSCPAFQGQSCFAGPIFHSARWPDDLDLAGRRVAIVGTGASAMQIVPSIGPIVDQLTVYQRSPQWARPLSEYHRACPPGTTWLLENVPYYAAWFRFTLFWRYGDGLHPFLQRDPDWPHPERSINRRNDRHREELTAHITDELRTRPDLIDKCLPRYPPWGKRMLIDNGWYETLLRPNVELVTDPISSFDKHGIITTDGQHRPADVVVLATGFKVTELTARLGVTGRNGTLDEAWAGDNPTAYLGITVPGFPNLFLMYGPNTNVAHGGSNIFQAECQARYITSAVVQMIEGRVAAIDCRSDVHDDYISRLDAAHANMVWTHPGMDTWYRNADGRVISPTPWRFVDYWAMTHRADLTAYHRAAQRPPPADRDETGPGRSRGPVS
jgi:4-hydroxyacetophenone monooxygenase